MQQLPWIIAALGALAVITLIGVVWVVSERSKPPQLPKEWSLSARPVFSPEERLVYRQLRDAFPHHIILAKIPLVRFCQPSDTSQARYWYDLLGSINVGFVICAANGRVLAALDLETPRRQPSRRLTTIKQSVLSACRVRYVKCRPEQLPSAAELQMLVPHQGVASRAAVPGAVESLKEARTTLAHAVRARRTSERSGDSRDSRWGHDSFFVPDSRMAEFGTTDPAELTSLPTPLDKTPGGARNFASSTLDPLPSRFKVSIAGDLPDDDHAAYGSR